MSFALKPIQKLVTLSLILHVISLFVVAIIVVFQLPLKNLIIIDIGGDIPIPFVLPNVIAVARMIIVFIIHLILTIIFYRTIKNNDIDINSLKTTSILSLVSTIIIIPMLSRILTRIEMWLLPWHGFEHLSSQTTLNFLMSYGLTIRDVALSILLIAASMAFYYCYLVKAGKDLQ